MSFCIAQASVVVCSNQAQSLARSDKRHERRVNAAKALEKNGVYN